MRYTIQIVGIGALMLSGLQSPVMIVVGVLLFGFGIGNATSFPPLIAQVEFAKEDAVRVVPLIVAMAQATYAFCARRLRPDPRSFTYRDLAHSDCCRTDQSPLSMASQFPASVAA